MSMKTMRPLLVVAAVAAALALSGCATPIAGGAGSPAAGTPEPAGTQQPAPTSPDVNLETGDVGAFWAPGGSGVLITTWGSGSCVPVVAGVETLPDGFDVVFTEPDPDRVCTMDYTQRVTYAPIVDTADRTAPTSVTIHLDGVDTTVDVAPYTGTVSSEVPIAGFTPDGVVAIVSEGSGSCRPIVSGVTDETASGMTVTFAPHDGPCTRDLQRRATLVASSVIEPGATLTLVGLEGAAEPTTLTVGG